MRIIVRVLCLFTALGGIPMVLGAQSDLFAGGRPSASPQYPVEHGSINLANGNLHLEIPIATHKQRGQIPTVARFVYDSSIWHGVTDSSGHKQWMPDNITNHPGGWRFESLESVFGSAGNSSGVQPMTTANTSCSSLNGNGTNGATITGPFLWSDVHGSAHTFPIFTTQIADPIAGCTDPNHPDTPSGSGYATDSSGYFATVTGYFQLTVYDQNGTALGNQATGGPEIVQDPNGNFYDTLQQDDLGRNLVTITPSPTDPTQTFFDVLTTGGGTVRYVLTTESISLNTNFLAASVGSDFQGNITVYKSISLPDGSSYQFSYEPNYGELTGITLPHGGTVSYTYLSGLNGTRAGEQVPPRWVASHFGADGTTTFSILPSGNGGNGNACGSIDFPCFNTDNYVTRNGKTIDYSFRQTGNGAYVPQAIVYFNTTLTPSFGQPSAASGSVANASMFVQEIYDDEDPCVVGNCPQATGNGYLHLFVASTTYVDTALTSETRYQSSLPGSGVNTSIQQFNYFTGPTNPLAIVNPPSSPIRDTEITFGPIINGSPRPAEVKVLNGAGTTVSDVTYRYDEHALQPSGLGPSTHLNAVSSLRGNVTTISESLVPLSGTVFSSLYYYDTGNVYQVIDPNSNTTTYKYDSTGTFLGSVTLPLTGSAQHTYQGTYDISSGQILTATEQNGVVSRYSYDSLGRPDQVSRLSNVGGKTTYTYPSVNEVDVSDQQSSAVTVQSSRTTDAYGRVVSSASSGISSETTYDSLGRVSCIKTAHLSSASSTDGSTCYQYDSLDRVSQVTQPDGNVYQLQYTDNVLLVTDEVGHQRKYTYDGLGQLASVTEQDDGGVLDWETDYQYDGLGRVSQIQQKGGSSDSSQWRTRTFSYNALGWLLSESSPEAGTRTFTQYDNNGNALLTTDARGNTVSFAYDSLNRLTKKTLSTGTAHTYTYDSQDGSHDPYGIGRLTSVSNGSNVGAYFTHDPAGNIASESYCLPSNCSYTETTAAQYDFHGNIVKLTYPDSRAVGFVYDPNDRLTSETYLSWGPQSVNVPYLTSGTYYPTGALQSAIYGNGVGVSAGVNPRGNLTSLTYQKGSAALLSKQYAWDKNAINLLNITDTLQGIKRTFTYDFVNRLRSATDQVTGSGPGVSGTGSVTISGREQAVSKTICKIVNGVRRCTPTTVYDSGTLTVTIGSFTQSVSYGGGSTPDALASGIASAVNAASGSPVTATVSGATVMFTANGVGTGTDYGLSTSISSSDPTDFPMGSFASTSSGSSLGGGGNGNTLSVTYSLDAWGNLKQSGTFSFIQPFGSNNQIAAAGYTYDAAGNLTQDGLGNNYTYDAEGKMSSSNGAVYTRDGLGQRVRKDLSSASTEYIFFDGRLIATHDPNNGQGAAGGWTDYIYAGGRLIAENQGTPTSVALFRLGDHLDSLAALTDGAGNATGQNDYAPYGQLLNGSASSRLQFTQHERDTENSSDSTLFRQYASAQGRWLSPDPSNGSYDLTDPQSLNRYSYLRGRPLTDIDPFGLDGGSDCTDDNPDGCDPGSSGGDGSGGDNPPATFSFNLFFDPTEPSGGVVPPDDPNFDFQEFIQTADTGYDVGALISSEQTSPVDLPSIGAAGGGGDSVALDGLQTVLAFAGVVPGLNIPANAINAGISVIRGNYGQAAISAAAVILPGLGVLGEAAGVSNALVRAAEAGEVGETIAARVFYATEDGFIIQSPEGYEPGPASNDRGLVLRPAGQAPTNNSNIIRYGEPDGRNPTGYFRYYNNEGQPLNPITGNPGSDPETHIPTTYIGPLNGFPR